MRIPAEVLELARALRDVAVASERFCRSESVGPAMAVQGALAARKNRTTSRASLRARKGLPAGDWQRLLRCLGDACDELGWACAEAVAEPRRWTSAVAALSESAAALLAALENSGSRDKRLVSAKKQAALAAEHCRRALKEAREEPNVVLELKLGGIGRRLSMSAESLQEAADVFAEILIQ